MRRSWLRLFWLAVVLVGAVAGYLVSSGLGTRLVHDEIERQLSRLLEGPVEIGVVEIAWRDGIEVEALDLAAYPDADAERAPVMRARRILARLDGLALLVGRVELSGLALEGPRLRLVQQPDGTFAGLPLAPPDRAYPDEGLDERGPAERFFAQIAALDAEADRFARAFRVADVIEVSDGTIEWLAAEAPATRIEALEGRAERDWLSDAIAIDFRGVVNDAQRSPTPFELGIHRAEGRHFAWTLSLPQIPLDASEAPFSSVEGLESLDGTLDVRLRLATREDGLHRLSLDGHVRDATVVSSRSGTVLERDLLELGAELVIDPVEVRLERARLEGPRMRFDFQGAIERPIRPRAAARIETRTRGVELEGLRDYALSLEGESQTAFTLARLTERIEGGRILYVEMAGEAPLSRWQDLVSGRLREIPAGFVLGGALEDVRIETGPGDRIEGLAAEVEWVEDQIVIRRGRGTFRGRPLPELNVVIDGVSHLVTRAPEEREMAVDPPPLPGLRPFFEILRPRDPDQLPPIKAIGLALDELQHPLFRWPLRDLRVLIEPLRRGIEIGIRDGLWGGARVKGEVVWFDDPESPTVSANLALREPSDDPSDPTRPMIPASDTEASLLAPPASPDPTAEGVARAAPPAAPAGPVRWGEGRFEMEFRPRRFLPFEQATGVVKFEGSRLYFDDLDIAVERQGRIAARMALDFDHEETVGFDVTFALEQGRLQEIGPFVALPEDLATGAIDASGGLAGRVRPRTSFIAELEGRVRAEARSGEVRMTLPLLFRLAKATEGYNPFAEADRLEYETMEGTFVIDRGVLSVEDFEIEGPLRVYAQADIDTLKKPANLRAVVGIFLFRKPSTVLDNLPLIRSFLPGSDKGLIGTYFRAEGPLAEPEIEPLALSSLMTGVPEVIKAPFKVLRSLFDGDGDAS